jgi:hypothetical protein
MYAAPGKGRFNSEVFFSERLSIFSDPGASLQRRQKNSPSQEQHMPSITAIFLVDSTATIDLVITASSSAPPNGPTLLELKIVDENHVNGPRMEAQNHSSGALPLNTQVTRVLSPGVYYFTCDGEIRYDVPEGRCRTIFVNGKNPISPPPPPAPAGTPLATHSTVYASMFDDILANESGSPGRQWMVIGIEERQTQSAVAG